MTAENVEKLEQRLRHAETKNKILTSELAKAKATSASEQSQTTSPTYSESTTPLKIPDGPISRPDTAGDVITEASYLSINTTRERQYPSSTSGILFAKLVRASVDVFSITGNGPV